jgi:ribosomal protection tetracycline resistance protein
MLNLGILAHVDAGKTTLTERLLHTAGIIDEIGSVDAGTTQTDSLALERQRGITIKSAVVSFAIGGVDVNLIDTPGHPDFIAEVERALSVLDGAVLVISAVEGVQPQTRILMRALRRLHVPTLMFVNKIDRRGAGDERLLRAISDRLTPTIVPMGCAGELGTRAASFAPAGGADATFTARLAEVLAEHDDSILAAYVHGGPEISYRRLRHELGAQTRKGYVHPVFFGSALTGAGVGSLMGGIAELLPPAGRDTTGPPSGRVFKIERGPAGEKVAYVRMFSGTVRTRDQVQLGRSSKGKVTEISVFADGPAVRRQSVSAGEIGKLWGLTEAQVGDTVGTPPQHAGQHHRFAPPTLETVIVPRNPADRAALRVALGQLAEQDPLINVLRDDVRQEISISLYGEVQKEVIEATLATDYGLEVDFHETTTICIERPVRTGAAEEILHAPSNPFLATVGIRIDPAPIGLGIEFRLQAGHQTVPLYIYKNMRNFAGIMERYVRQTLQEGLSGWQVTDCTVTLVKSGYSSPDGPPAARGPLSGPGDFRKLTPLVLMLALKRAGTVVCEPIHRFRLDAPADTLGMLLPSLARLRAVPHTQVTEGASSALEGDIPAAHLHGLRQQLPGLTRGEGVLECTFDRYEPVRGTVPTRPRTDNDPLNREEYLQRVIRPASRTNERRETGH